MYDLINLTETKNIPGMFLLIDFEKAFDSVSHKFIMNILDKFNFRSFNSKMVSDFL